MKLDFKRLFINILIPVGLGFIVSLITNPSGSYKDMIQPSFAPPGILFPIVWTILYILMGISSYIIEKSNDSNYKDALSIYYAQLVVNLTWSFIFFMFKSYLLAFIWIILLIVLVIKMIKSFYSISKLGSYLQIPYLLWIIFAAILNFSIYLLN